MSTPLLSRALAPTHPKPSLTICINSLSRALAQTTYELRQAYCRRAIHGQTAIGRQPLRSSPLGVATLENLGYTSPWRRRRRSPPNLISHPAARPPGHSGPSATQPPGHPSLSAAQPTQPSSQSSQPPLRAYHAARDSRPWQALRLACSSLEVALLASCQQRQRTRTPRFPRPQRPGPGRRRGFPGSFGSPADGNHVIQPAPLWKQCCCPAHPKRLRSGSRCLGIHAPRRSCGQGCPPLGVTCLPRLTGCSPLGLTRPKACHRSSCLSNSLPPNQPAIHTPAYLPTYLPTY